MPGGYSGYLTSLRKVCTLIADERPTPAELASRLEEVLEVKATGARLRESFLRKVGIISVHDGTCSLGAWSEKWLASGDDRILVALLHGRCQFIGEGCGSSGVRLRGAVSACCRLGVRFLPLVNAERAPSRKFLVV